MPDKHIFKGLTDEEVSRSRRDNGSNILTPPKRVPLWKEFLRKFSDPLIVILMVAGVLSVGISFYEYFGLGKDWKVFFEPVGIFVAIGLATTLSFIFEQRADKAFQILNCVSDDQPVEVLRQAGVTTVARKEVVVDDIVFLNTGDEIPADGELLDAASLGVDESSLTGEPLCAKTIDPACFDQEAVYESNRVMRGTKVMEGHGLMRVLRVGDATEMGKVYRQAQIDDTVETPLNMQLDKLAGLITDGSYIVAALVIVGGMITFLGWHTWQAWLPALPVGLFFWLVIKEFDGWGKTKCILTIAGFTVLFLATVALACTLLHPGMGSAEWAGLLSHTLQTLMVAVTLIVVAVPEGLPMAVTLSLAYSMGRMLQTNNLVRKMHACETMGAATVICTDKTGTLTQNRMQVSRMDIFKPRSGEISPEMIRELLEEGIAVNSTAQLDLTDGEPHVVGNPTEGALLLWLRDRGTDYATVRGRRERLAELPFTTERKYMATLVRSASGKRILYVKGAPERVLAMCAPPEGRSKAEIESLLDECQSQGMRTLGFAYAEIEEGEEPVIEGLISSGKLVFLAIAAIADPIRQDVAAAVGEVSEAGIKVKIVTGDTAATAKEIGREIGLWDDSTDTGHNIITGEELAALSDEELQHRAPELKIIARARPMDKKRLVEALQRDGEVVAATGDGTNDAPALKTAHVGLSMGSGTAVAKEASDITILDDSFASIVRAVMWGRSLYKNIRRFLLFQLTVNVAACLLVLFGSFMGEEPPLTVTQMLWVNLIMDTFGAMALASLPPSAKVMGEKPRSRNEALISGAMLREIIGVGMVFFAITLGFYWLFNHAEVTSLRQIWHAGIGAERGMTPYEGTLLFSIFVWTHFWYMFNARGFDTGASIFRLRMSSGFWTIVAIIVAGQLAITEVGYEFFNVEPMLHTSGWKFNPSGALDLLTIAGGSTLVVWVREAYLLLTKK